MFPSVSPFYGPNPVSFKGKPDRTGLEKADNSVYFRPFFGLLINSPRMAGRGNLALSGRSNILILNVLAYRDKTPDTIILRCPYCGGIHRHGDSSERGEFLRIPHCPISKTGRSLGDEYRIHVVSGKLPENLLTNEKGEKK